MSQAPHPDNHAGAPGDEHDGRAPGREAGPARPWRRPRYAAGDVIDLPPEPPLGAVIAATDHAGQFLLTRRSGGWHVTGSTRQGDPLSWDTVARLWFPVTVVDLPPTPHDDHARPQPNQPPPAEPGRSR